MPPRARTPAPETYFVADDRHLGYRGKTCPYGFFGSTSICKMQGFLRSRWSVEMTGIGVGHDRLWGGLIDTTAVLASLPSVRAHEAADGEVREDQKQGQVKVSLVCFGGEW